MANNLHEKQPSTEELIEAQAHLWNISYSFMNPMCLKCAIELNIPEIIHNHGKPMTLAELIKALPINKSKTHCVDSLMRVLVHAKFFTEVSIAEDGGDEIKGFVLTPAYRPFLTTSDDGGGLSLVSFSPLMFGPEFLNPWHEMSNWLKNDDPSLFWTFHGKNSWEHFGQNPEMNKAFSDGMASDTLLSTRIVPKHCREVFQGLSLMVDVGGRSGYMSRSISDEFPGLKCIVLDLPQAADVFEGSSDRVSFVSGDMFESIPSCEAVFFKWILHNWSHEDCLRILKNCKEAVTDPSRGKRGKVIIIDIILGDRDDDHEATETQIFYDMLMLVNLNGRERTEKEWAKLFTEAGFASYKITPLLGLKSLIEVFP